MYEKNLFKTLAEDTILYEHRTWKNQAASDLEASCLQSSSYSLQGANEDTNFMVQPGSKT